MTSEQWSTEVRARIHGALGDPYRLAIVDALAVSDLAPSEVRDLIAIESNLLAHHLDVLSDAGVIGRTPSHGDRRRRYLHLRPEPLAAIAQPLTIAATEVLFVCTANSARSQLAAALWNAHHGVPAART